MSVKFVQSSDNKYVQYRFLLSSFTDAQFANKNNWQEEIDGIEYVEDEDYLFYLLDANKKIFLALKKDGDLQFGYGVPSQIVTYVTGLINALGVDTILTFLNGVQNGNTIDGLYGGYKDDDNYLYVLTDANKKMLMAYKKDGTLVCNNIDSPTITVINNSITDIIHRLDNLNVEHTLNVQNSDKIAIIGDSYTQSGYCVKGKSYIQKLSLFSDYVWSNFGVSGDTYAGRMEAIRTNAKANGNIAFVDQAIKYAMLCCYTNDVKYMSVDDYITCTKQICMLLQGIGVSPIVCTEYHTGNTATLKTAVRSSLKNLADNYNLQFYDIASIVDLIIGNSKYGPFWGGSHPGTRSNAIESDNYEKYLSALERPMKSLKLFRARNNSYESLDEYMFHSNENRAEIFKEIIVGAQDLTSAANVDNCTSAAQTKTNSEYQLLASKSAVAFNEVSLLSAVLSTDKNHLGSLILNIAHTSESLRVYVKNTLASPYPVPTKYSSFQVEFDTEPSIDSTYKCEEDNTTYTVKAVVTGGDGAKNILCLPFVASPSSNSGTLTKLSGTGDSTIAYSHRERGMDVDSINDDTIGHWSEVTAEADGSYNLGNKPNCVDIDRVDILLVSESAYIITDVKLTYTGEEKDTHKGKEFVFETNLYNSNEELLPSNTFGTIGVLDTNWNVTPTNTYEGTNGTNVFPVGCSSKVNIDSTNKLSCNVTASKTGNAVMEVWCRYFPDVYTNGSGNQITEDSYDYSDLIVNLNTVSMRERVNTHWKMVRFPVYLIAGTQAVEIASNKGLEIAYVSLKYKN
jgi:hypothetical protein